MTCYFCQRPVKRAVFHHPVYKSDGGTETWPAHYICHVRHHKREGDFKRWGSKGGKASAIKLYWIYNLRFGNGPAQPGLRMLKIKIARGDYASLGIGGKG